MEGLPKLTPEIFREYLRLRELVRINKDEESRKNLIEFAIKYGADAGSGTILDKDS